MTVRELIIVLERLPQSLQVAYQLHSECKLLEAEDIMLENLQPARADGWIHTFSRNKDAETVTYVMFPGN
jgi:hypothetical protein